MAFHWLRSLKLDFGNNQKLSYHYDGSGRKLTKVNTPASNPPTNTEYRGPLVHESYNSVSSLKYIITPEGRLKNTGTNAAPVWGWEYDLTDHLGNVRVTFKPNATNNGVVRVEYANYFPFGMKMLAPYSTYLGAKYLYNGKEYQDDFGLNWYDYGARFYDPAIGRWSTPEPYAELVPGISVYAYCYDNPINYTEPDGRWPGWVHARIIRKALNPYINHGLIVEQVDQIIAGGAFIDKYFQDPKYSYMHSMRNGLTNQSILGAMAAREEWVSNNIAIFKASGGKDFQSLGFAIHAMSDRYAPTHSWKSWSGLKLSNGFGIPHFLGELNPLGKFSSSFKLSEILVKQTYQEATKTESTSSTTPAPVSPRPVDPPIDPITPNPCTPTPAPAPSPMPMPQPQPPVPLPPLN
jgi:RHS repeat-associated protein